MNRHNGMIGPARTNPTTGQVELIPGEECWIWDLTVNEQSGFFNDMVTFNGQVTHICAPADHPEDDENGGMNRFNYTVDANDRPFGFARATATSSLTFFAGTDGWATSTKS